MPSHEEVQAAGIAYWNYYRQLDGNKPEPAFTLDGDFAGAIGAALVAAELIRGERRIALSAIADPYPQEAKSSAGFGSGDGNWR